MGVAFAIEADRWIVTLAGYAGERPPAELAPFLEFARSLPAPDLHQLIAHAEPIGDAATIRFPANTRRRWESLRRRPRGFIAFGDAVVSLNPCYGQGITSAALQSVALRRALEHRRDLERRFFTEAAGEIDGLWQVTTSNDLRLPQLDGPRPLFQRLLNRYLDRVRLTATHDPVVAHAFLEVASVRAPPPTLLHPRILLRTLAPARPRVLTSGGVEVDPGSAR
jgi:2-polyprenyl-6-methoxyphenol hydroxylase-like FAD-dependent oxidoreductase